VTPKIFAPKKFSRQKMSSSIASQEEQIQRAIQLSLASLSFEDQIRIAEQRSKEEEEQVTVFIFCP
jgi:hypothetical protein